MNSQFLIEKLESSEEFKKFMNENPKSYLCSGFFLIDLESEEQNKYHFDFYTPETGKVLSFELESGIKPVPLERSDGKALNKVSPNVSFDFDEIQKIISEEMEKNKVKNKIQKLIFSLQNIEGNDVMLGTIFVSGFGIVKANVNIKDRKVTDFEKKSFWDMLNVMRRK